MYLQTDDLNCLNTETSILPELFNGNISSVTKNYGKPQFMFTEKNITIFIYKWKLNNLKIRCKIHFYKNKVFLVNHNYLSLSHKEKAYVLNSLLKKYLPMNDTPAQLSTCKITDANQNMIFINDLLELKINYFKTNDSDWFNNMYTDYMDKLKKQEIHQNLRQLKYLAVI